MYICKTLHIIFYDCTYVEILEALSSLSMPTTTTTFANSTTVINQQFTRSTTLHHTSSVSSVKPTTTHISTITQSPQGLLNISIVCIVNVEEYRSTR